MNSLAAILISAFFLLASAECAFAVAEIQRVEVELQPDGKALVRSLFFIDSSEREIFTLPATGPFGVRAYDSAADLPFSVSRGLIDVQMGGQEEGYSFTVEYESQSLTYKNGSDWSFMFDFIPLGAARQEFSVAFPENARLLSLSPQGAVYTRVGKIHADVPVQEARSTRVEAGYSFEETGRAQDTPAILFPAGLLAALLLIAAFFLFRKVRKPAEDSGQKGFSEGQLGILKTLSVNEEKAVKELFQREKMTQKSLMVATGIPKATLSRTLKGLQQKTIVEIRGSGTTNIVLLSKWFRER